MLTVWTESTISDSMLPATSNEGKAKRAGRKSRAEASGRGTTRYAGIVADAKSLGVNRIHLWRVLNGRRQSQRLLARYRALQRGRAGKN